MIVLQGVGQCVMRGRPTTPPEADGRGALLQRRALSHGFPRVRGREVVTSGNRGGSHAGALFEGVTSGRHGITLHHRRREGEATAVEWVLRSGGMNPQSV